MIRLQREAIDVASVLDGIRRDEAGAVTSFAGTVRGRNEGKRVRWMEYEAYPELALVELERLEREAIERDGVLAVALVHRTGRIEVGEVAVVVAVASAHRAEGFEACRFLIDTLKRDVPIWKKEVFEDGAIWVEDPSRPG